MKAKHQRFHGAPGRWRVLERRRLMRRMIRAFDATPLKLNAAQAYLMSHITERAAQGKPIRVFILKGRNR